MVFILTLIFLVILLFLLQDKSVRKFFTKFGRYIFAAIASVILIILLGPARILNFIFSAIITMLPFWTNKSNTGKSNNSSYSNRNQGVKAHHAHDEIQEALEILELTGNPNKNDVEQAYRKLIKKHHPDKGGSKYFTRKIIKARKVLLNNIKE